MMFQTSDADVMFNPSKASTAEPEGTKPIRQRIEKIRLGSDGNLAYYYFRSSRPRDELPLFVAVHGICRRALDQARLFAPMIDAVGGTMVAPVFKRNRFKDYQRLGRSGRGERSDLAFQRMLTDIDRIGGRHFNRMVMFGYSGGGQFVHRYAMAYPRQVRRMAIAAPGWFTFPDLDIKFPHGVKATTDLPDLNFDAARFLKIPAMVLVGEADTLRDKALNQRDRIDRRQGPHRLERARRWRAAMSAAAARFNYETPYAFFTVPNCGHSFVDCMTRGQMGREIVRFLFDDIRRPGIREGQCTIRQFDLPAAKGEIS